MSKLKLLSQEPTLLDRVKDELGSLPVTEREREQLASLILDMEFFEPYTRDSLAIDEFPTERLNGWIRFAQTSFTTHDRDTAFIRLASIDLGFGPGFLDPEIFLTTTSDQAKRTIRLNRWLSADLDLQWAKGLIGLLECSSTGAIDNWYKTELLRFLLSSPALTVEFRGLLLADFIAVVEIHQLLQEADAVTWGVEPYSDHRCLDFWLQFDMSRALEAFFHRFALSPLSESGHLAVSVYILTRRAFQASVQGAVSIELGLERFPGVLQRYFNEIEKKRQESPQDIEIDNAFWCYLKPRHWFPFYGWVDGFTLDRKQAGYIREAGTILGRLSADFASGTYRQSNGVINLDYYNTLVDLIRDESGVWSALKVLLLAFSKFQSQAVAIDLRTWPEPGQPELPDYPWRWVPERISALIHNIRDEQEADPKLEAIRTAFAEFCLSRLKAREKIEDGVTVCDEMLVETRGVWREAYARAIVELRANPKGKGHHALYWSRRHDPNQDVREAAKVAYKVLHRDPSWPDKLSPRRALFGAFYWLRAAHLQHLGIDPDPRGAQRTRSKEVTWTTRIPPVA